MRYLSKGFTLLEFMIVLLIIGVLAALAYPRYDAQIKRGYRTEGQGFLNEVAARQERYFSQNNSYLIPEGDSDDLAGLGLTNPAKSASNKYQLKITSEDNDCGYSLIAQQQFNDSQCGNLTLNGLGIQGRTGSDKSVAECWR